MKIQAPLVPPPIFMGLEYPRFCTTEVHGHQRAYCYVTRVRTGSVATYRQWAETFPSYSPPPSSLANLLKPKLKRQISSATSRKCRNMLRVWGNSLKCAVAGREQDEVYGVRSMAMVTLTLPVKQFHTDNEVKRHMLYGFIRDLQRNHGLVHYYWRAEAQANANIHFHVIVDCFIDSGDLDRAWFNQLALYGYLEAYHEQTGSLFPPAVNVIGCGAGSELFDYVCKYATKSMLTLPKFEMVDGKRVKSVFFVKNEEWAEKGVEARCYRVVEGREWGCSDLLRSLTDFKVIESDHSAQMVGGMVDARCGRLLNMERAVVVVGKVVEWLRYKRSSLYRGWVSHMRLMFRLLYMGMDYELPPYWAKSDQCVQWYRHISRISSWA